jgi:hypothetical protein
MKNDSNITRKHVQDKSITKHSDKVPARRVDNIQVIEEQDKSPPPKKRRRLIRGTDLKPKLQEPRTISKTLSHTGERLRQLARGQNPKPPPPARSSKQRTRPEPSFKRSQTLPQITSSSRAIAKAHVVSYSHPRSSRLTTPVAVTPARRREIKTRRRLLMYWRRTLEGKIEEKTIDVAKIDRELEGLVVKEGTGSE